MNDSNSSLPSENRPRCSKRFENGTGSRQTLTANVVERSDNREVAES